MEVRRDTAVVGRLLLKFPPEAPGGTGEDWRELDGWDTAMIRAATAGGHAARKDAASCGWRPPPTGKKLVLDCREDLGDIIPAFVTGIFCPFIAAAAAAAATLN